MSGKTWSAGLALADILVAVLKDEFGKFDEALEIGVPVVESIEIVPE